MNSDRDLAAMLAEEIRSAVAERSPLTSHPLPPKPSAAIDEAARSAMERSRSYLTPTVPQAAPFSRAKRMALRLLRFVWRDQATFNALSLETLETLWAAVSSQREILERIHADVVQFERELMTSRAEIEQSRLAAEKKISFFERREAIGNARLAALESAASGRVPDAPSPSPIPSAIPAGVYSLFEERFRGTPEEIAAKQSGYVELLEGIPGPVLDVGCGRGEFLRLLSERGIPASGVDNNPIAVAECRRLGLAVEQDEGISALARRPPGSLGAVVALQVIEHWSPGEIFSFLREARRVIAPSGLLIVETINVDSLSAWKAFFLDPSHTRPVPPQALGFLAEAAGFCDGTIEYRSPLPAQERLAESSENDAKLNRLLFGPQDYALVARVPQEHREIG